MPIPSLPALPVRARDAHKGRFGTCVLVGGSCGMMGALILAGRAALRSGVGLVRLGTPQSQMPVLPSAVPEATSFGLAEEEGRLCNAAKDAILEQAAQAQALALGPGLRNAGSIPELVQDVAHATTSPLVLDADALNALQGNPASLQDVKLPIILTPHPGEAARLLGVASSEEVQVDRAQAAKELAKLSDAIVVLKGSDSIVQEPPDAAGSFAKSKCFVNETGNPGMATAGSGDVLTGMLAALLAQGMTAFDAACLAVHAHGLAGDLAVASPVLSQAGLIAGDLVERLPEVWRQLGSL